LATGLGKSMMLGILAEYFNKTHQKKVLVVVPTAFLHLYQESNYCPTASKIPEDINDPTATQIFYCIYEHLL
jgi:ERCC4-related helicase